MKKVTRGTWDVWLFDTELLYEIESFLAWADGGPVPTGAEVLKPDNVLCLDGLVLKRVEERSFKDLFRPSPLWRGVRVWEKYHSESVRFPRPYCLATRFKRGRQVLSVTEYLSGPDLWCCWVHYKHYALERDAISAFPVFMAQLHNFGLLHGDLHPGNLIWTGKAWALIDLESLRTRLKAHLNVSEVADQWARIYDKLRQPQELWSWLETYLVLSDVKFDFYELKKRINERAVLLQERRFPRKPYDPENYRP